MAIGLREGNSSSRVGLRPGTTGPKPAIDRTFAYSYWYDIFTVMVFYHWANLTCYARQVSIRTQLVQDFGFGFYPSSGIHQSYSLRNPNISDSVEWIDVSVERREWLGQLYSNFLNNEPEF